MRYLRQMCAGSLKVASSMPSSCLDQDPRMSLLSMLLSQVGRWMTGYLLLGLYSNSMYECCAHLRVTDGAGYSFSSHDVHQVPRPSLPYLHWATTSADGTTTTRRTCRQSMQALTITTSPTTSSGLTLNTPTASATLPGIHTNLDLQRTCCSASRTRNAR